MKWQLCAITLIAMIAIGLLAPQEPRDPKTRASQVTVSILPSATSQGQGDATAASRVASSARERYVSDVSDADAVRIAVARGEEVAAARAAGGNPRLREDEAIAVSEAVVTPTNLSTEVTQAATDLGSSDIAVTPNTETSADVEAAPEVEVARADPQASPTAQDAVDSVGTAPAAGSTAQDETPWRVTADRVNLRGGPSTNEPIVGRVGAGDALVPLSGLGTDWVEVKLPSGDTAWIFAEFLAKAEG
ncbi:MAG: SH3 domain-containing protein [Pseudomonadota bacterium]